ncbi:MULTISPECIES: DUF2497 domain-containing protein [Sphingomonas]|jgi:cell pole-organizing protein PopZ|uniref:DUF2497 domain-containing protein n=1 Tax=Sphingomonas leidyi TaxID=68569 RepID=A0A7X5UZ55_9SPHN|nr:MULTISPECIES: DUF2497 domain-containing protein [Sphingomonas]MBN8810660.1 DUF2497 domain-containing protein [Sphingomonas sp.]NIJ64600.1 hypothetical protein [Sphingomonas leidyi]OJY49423.1 MAG: hypothetical protein BGP17_12565 [Sphingomonas sp. 67-41]
MGDISSEPSMEEILSSIKRIIAEEGDAAIATRARRGGRAATVAEKSAAIDEVLELSQPVDEDRVETPTPMSMGSPTPPEAAPKGAAEQPADPILSDRAAEATRGPLEALSRMVVKPEVTGTDTLEGMVREMLKPMLRDWLDANLPRLVEEMVAREISRITGRQ